MDQSEKPMDDSSKADVEIDGKSFLFFVITLRK
jgi:hypothetical protein